MAIVGIAFIVGLIAWPMWLIYQQLVTRRDRDLSKVWGVSAICVALSTVGFGELAAVLKAPPCLCLWLFYFGFGSALFCGIGARVTNYMSRREDNSRRLALGLEPRKQLVGRPSLIAIWVVVCLVGTLIWAYGISALIDSRNSLSSGRDLTGGELALTLAFPALLVIAAFVHVSVQSLRIKNEENRLRRKDIEMFGGTA